jgi:hypothetical protein
VLFVDNLTLHRLIEQFIWYDFTLPLNSNATHGYAIWIGYVPTRTSEDNSVPANFQFSILSRTSFTERLKPSNVQHLLCISTIDLCPGWKTREKIK